MIPGRTNPVFVSTTKSQTVAIWVPSSPEIVFVSTRTQRYSWTQEADLELGGPCEKTPGIGSRPLPTEVSPCSSLSSLSGVRGLLWIWAADRSKITGEIVGHNASFEGEDSP